MIYIVLTILLLVAKYGNFIALPLWVCLIPMMVWLAVIVVMIVFAVILAIFR